MTAHQTAAYLQVAVDSLRGFEVNDGLPTHRLGDGPKAERRYFREELDRWVKSRCIDTAPDNGGEAVS